MNRGGRAWAWKGAAVALAVLTVGVGLCLFDGADGSDDHAVARDLCGGLLAALLTVTLLALMALSRVPMESLRPVPVVTARRLDPPPESSPLP